tara:strand:- start:10350 stop:11138 length:789 start_codon:yes stop_codon:yes gene_type:complete
MKKRKFKLNSKLTILILGFFVSILLFLSKDFNQIKHFKLHFSNFFSFLYKPKAFVNNINYLASENDSLLNHIKIISEENLNLKQRIRTINDHLNYDKKLDKLIPNFSFTPAKVISHSLTKSTHIFNVNVGTNDGVSEKYKAVINYDGNLVGKTWFVSEEATQVHKISDRNFHVYVKTKKDIFGQFSFKSGKWGIIESVSKQFEKSLNIGDIFYTTDDSNIYPENIPVAKIIDIQNRRNELELYVKVEIIADLNSLKNIFIVQ